MIKSFNMILIYPLIMNSLIIFFMMIPSKFNKFHPMTFLLILITLTFFICLKINFLYKSWINFIMFLTLIGGLMIIFMFIASLNNNEMFKVNLKTLTMMFIKSLPIMLFIIFTLYKLNFLNFNLSINLLEQMNMNYLYMKLFNKSNIFLMFYLFYSMIIIMNICFSYKFPLRQIKL